MVPLGFVSSIDMLDSAAGPLVVLDVVAVIDITEVIDKTEVDVPVMYTENVVSPILAVTAVATDIAAARPLTVVELPPDVSVIATLPIDTLELRLEKVILYDSPVAPTDEDDTVIAPDGAAPCIKPLNPPRTA